MPVSAKDLTALKVELGDDLSEILCSQPIADGYLFAAVLLKSGKYAAVWENHALVFGSRDEMLDKCNKHELALLSYGVQR